MTAEKSSLSTISQFELSPFITGNIKKSRAVTKQTFESVMNQKQEETIVYIPAPAYLCQQRPLPDGTGQILNIGI